MDDIELGPSWDFLKPENLPPCRLCDQPLTGWITSDSVHFECAQQYPDAMIWQPPEGGPGSPVVIDIT